MSERSQLSSTELIFAASADGLGAEHTDLNAKLTASSDIITFSGHDGSDTTNIRLAGLAEPTEGTDAATKAYVDQHGDSKESVQVMAVEDIIVISSEDETDGTFTYVASAEGVGATLTDNLDTRVNIDNAHYTDMFDGQTLSVGDRVLINSAKASDGSENQICHANGIYDVTRVPVAEAIVEGSAHDAETGSAGSYTISVGSGAESTITVGATDDIDASISAIDSAEISGLTVNKVGASEDQIQLVAAEAIEIGGTNPDLVGFTADTTNTSYVSGSNDKLILTRAEDADKAAKFNLGASVFVESGTNKGGSSFLLTTFSGFDNIGNGDDLLANAIQFTQSSGGGSLQHQDTSDNSAHNVLFSSVGELTDMDLKSSASNFQFNPSSGNLSVTTVTCSSDITLKKNIRTIEGGLDKVNQIRPIEWNWREEANGDTTSTRMGVSAQQLQKILPDSVVKGSNGNLAVVYNDLIGVLISSIQELSKKVEKLEQ